VADEGMVRYIRERLGEGYKEAEIRAALQGHGHPDTVIDDAFSMIHKSQKSNPLLIVLVLLILIMIGVIAFLVLQEEEAPPPVENTTPTVQAPTSQSVIEIAADLKEQRATLEEDELYYETVEIGSKETKNVGDGILICSLNRNTNYKNWCLIELADQQVEPEYCTIISNPKQRDECYLTIIMHGEDQYCSKLLLDENKRVCELLLGGS
jgi:hypothetical protein